MSRNKVETKNLASQPDQFISVDWGTSKFRAKLVQWDSLEVIKQIETSSGIKEVAKEYEDQNEIEREEFYKDRLFNLLSEWSNDINHMPLVLSGMASSTIGLKELGYADMPISVDGQNLIFEDIGDTNSPILLISGAKSEDGFMRGEEVQAIGVADRLRKTGQASILILPGTHSKHMFYKEDSFYKMKNFMTGELFDTLSRSSILSYSMKKTPLDDQNKAAFIKGTELGFQGKLSQSLLLIRLNDIILKQNPKDNYYYLSGMIIGDELSYLKNSILPIYLSATQDLKTLYSLALHHIIHNDRIIIIDEQSAERSTLIGQQKIIKRYYGNG